MNCKYKNALETIASWGLFGRGNCPHGVTTAIDIAMGALKESPENKQPKDTMEVRIAVVAAEIDGEIVYASVGSNGGYTDAQLISWALDLRPEIHSVDPCGRSRSFITARVPLPPKPIIHEVQGKVDELV